MSLVTFSVITKAVVCVCIWLLPFFSCANELYILKKIEKIQGHNGVPPDTVAAVPGKDGIDAATQYNLILRYTHVYYNRIVFELQQFFVL